MPTVTRLQPAFSIEDPRLSERDMKTCTLLLLAGGSQFSYAILDTMQQEFIALRSYHYQLSHQWKTDHEMLERFFDADAVLHQDFGKIKAGYHTHENTWVPSGLYNPSLQQAYFRSLHTVDGDDLICTDEIREYGLANIYNMSRPVREILLKALPAPLTYHAVTALLKGIHQRYAQEKRQQLFIFIQSRHVWIIAMKDAQLQLASPFYYASGSDVVYHVLNVIRQLGMEAGNVQCLLGGEITREAKVYEELYKYLPELDWLERPGNFAYSEAFSPYTGNQFYNLFALALCE